MNSDSKLMFRVTDLALHFMNGTLDEKGLQDLEELLETNPLAVEYYVEILWTHVGLNSMEGISCLHKAEHQIYDEDLWQALLQEEKTARAVEIPQEECRREREIIREVNHAKIEHKMNRRSLYTLITSIAAIFLIVLFLRFAPPATGVKVAVLSDSLNAKWADINGKMEHGTSLATSHESLLLREGYAEILFDNQAKITLEGPAEFQILTEDQIRLSYGRLYAVIPQEAIGFTVNTPSARIIDLGTEFGIDADTHGDTYLHVLKGKTVLIAGEKSNKISVEVDMGAAKKVSGDIQTVSDIPYDGDLFVREISSTSNLAWRGQKAIRLADLLLGGNGFGTASQWGISYELDTGKALISGDSGYRWYRSGPGKVVPFADNPYLDCIFVPGVEGGPTSVTSQGHQFFEAPPTTGLYYANVSCLKGCTFFDPLETTFEQSRKQYPDSAVLYLHSNIGMTVDLNAVRRAVSGFRIYSFSAFAGILRMADNTPDYSEVDVWVLVDGQLRSSQKKLRADQGYDIDVDIADQDRFLTLIVTDGGQSYIEGKPANHTDTCGFAEPVFGLVPPSR